MIKPNFRDSRTASVKSIRTHIFAIILLFLALSSAWGQGTVQFGFEEFQVKDLPPFVTGQASVEDSTSSFYINTPAFEGQKFLVGYWAISIASPDGQPIKSVNMRIFLPRHSVPPNDYNISGNALSATRSGLGDWQPLQATFKSPVQALQLIVSWSFETVPAYFGIDGVEFVTVPEPQTYWLLSIGLTAIAFRPLLKRSKPI
jgi:hypothetical protein